MTPEAVIAELLDRFEGLQSVETWGETSLFYNPGQRFSRGVYFATVKTKDGPNDKGSNLDRDGVFRLNLGLDKVDFLSLFGPPPSRPGKGETIEGPWDFATLNQIMPHPIYGWMSWIAVLNPDEAVFSDLLLLAERSYSKAKRQFDQRLAKAES